MKTKIVIGLLTVAVILAWTGVAGAQTATPASKVQLPSGETVWDLSGDWEALIEHFGPMAPYGTYPNVYRITQTGSAVSAIRLMGPPPPATGRAGTPSLRGELDKSGFKRVEIVGYSGAPEPVKGQISEDGKKIILDDGWTVKVTLTRPGGPDTIKALLLRPAGWKADWSLPGGYDKGEGEWIFEARGDKVVVKIQTFTRPTTCERDVTLTSDGVKFDGCRDLDITLRFDPNDLDYPFKGKSLSGTEYKGKAK
jgi:hypothetical protein